MPQDLPAGSINARQQELINLAYNQAEQQLREGTAPPSVVCQLLRFGTVREELELENLRAQQRLAEARVKAIDSQEHMEEMMAEAFAAFKSYGIGASWSNKDEPM